MIYDLLRFEIFECKAHLSFVLATINTIMSLDIIKCTVNLSFVN